MPKRTDISSILVIAISLALAACSGATTYEPGPISDEQFVALQEECGLEDARLSTGDRSVSFTTDGGIPVNGTIKADNAQSRTVIIGRNRSKNEMVGLIMCIAEFQDETGAEFNTDATAAGLGL